MLCLKNSLIIELGTRARNAGFGDNPNLNVSQKEKIDLLKERKILSELLLIYKQHEKQIAPQKIYIRDCLINELSFKQFLERERQKVFGNFNQILKLDDLTVITNNLNFSGNSVQLYIDFLNKMNLLIGNVSTFNINNHQFSPET